MFNLRSFLLTLAIIILFLVGCSRNKEIWDKLEIADRLIETQPDSSLVILESLSKDELKTKEEKAQYALLMSMALDKNYIDTTNFDVLQPAIDYYLKKGTPDEKLRTYYYQGRIYQNQGDKDNAMKAFYNALNIEPHIKDSLVLARVLIAQSVIYDNLHNITEYTEGNLRAAKIYKALNNPSSEFYCLLESLNGYIVLKDKNHCDSIISILDSFTNLSEEEIKDLNSYKLSYLSFLEDKEEIRNILDQDLQGLSIDAMFSVALAYHKIDENERAMNILDSLEDKSLHDSIRHRAILVSVLKDLGDYQGALTTFQEYSDLISQQEVEIYNQRNRDIEKKYQYELNARKEKIDKERIVWLFIGGVIILIMVIIILLLILRNRRIESKRLIGEQRQKELENENLLLEKMRLEDERDNFKVLIRSQKEMANPIKEVIKHRLDILNSLLAKEITNNDSYATSYNKWIETVRNDKTEFMNSNRTAMLASHPGFITYLEKKGLSTDEINYLCLYAIGLKGKEVGEYIKLKRHYNISSDIRRKLNIDEHETNIGIYIRKLIKELDK